MTAKFTRWLPEALLGVGLGLLLTGTPTLAVAQSTETPETPGLEEEAGIGDLSVSVRSASRMAGQYGMAGSLVSFDSRRTGDDRAALELVVNRKTLEAEFDFATRTGSWTGHGAILGADGKVALIGMEKAIAAEVAPKQDPPPQEQLLYRAVMLWSEAPAGLVLTSQSIEVNGERTEERELPESSTTGNAGSPEQCLDPLTGETSPAACQESNENGVVYLPTRVCEGDTSAECHDANGHCFRCVATNAGQPYNCKGRCGGGCCVPAGVGLYTYDCLDHDSCCGAHGGCFNPWDGECGDEYFEADDDFWASPNCDWAC